MKKARHSMFFAVSNYGVLILKHTLKQETFQMYNEHKENGVFHLTDPLQKHMLEAYLQWFAQAESQDDVAPPDDVVEALDHLASCPTCRESVFNRLLADANESENCSDRLEAAILACIVNKNVAVPKNEGQVKPIPEAARRAALRRTT